MVEPRDQNTPPGPAVDASGQAVIDPTENVKAILETAVKRLDDLREMESKHVREIGDLRMGMMTELRHSESQRIDAIRAVDAQQVQQAAQVSATQATTLAAQVATSADTLRNQVAAAATASTVALAAALDPIQKDIADLRRAQYEAQGQKTQVVETQGERGGQRQSVGLWIAAAAVVVTVVVAITGVIVATLVQNPTP